ncbi:MAG: sulfatase-like hydrolase/transferase [Vicinamibacteria bacterium]|nr:sulfatase-like hydrolase/transferase [Vicinamibacteria bacterium]
MTRDWKRLCAVTVILVYFHVGMEWLFFVTKPSFFSGLDAFENSLTLLITPLPAASLALALVVAFWTCARATATISILAARVRAKRARSIDRVAGRVRGRVGSAWRRLVRMGGERLCLRMALAIPAFLGAFCLLILADNFTMTVLGFGVRHAGAAGRWTYMSIVAALVAVLYRLFARFVTSPDVAGESKAPPLLALGLLVLSLLGVVVAWVAAPAVDASDRAKNSSVAGLPNVVLIGGDGLSAEHLSCYGYRRDTTPFLRSFVEQALVCRNHLTNAGSSGASLTAMFTSKLPARTRVFYPPDILRGRDAYQHLPAILRRAGYHSVEISMRHYADAYDLNLRDSFDSVNGRDIGARSIDPVLGAAFCSEIYFLGQIWERVGERLLHIIGARMMVDAFEEATAKKKDHYKDAQRMTKFLRFIEDSPEPFFAHLHLCATHGGMFQPLRGVYSRGKTQRREWMTDFYDDAILEFDGNVGVIMARLSSRGLLDHTIVAIYSDHGMQWTVDRRIPLIVRFPGDSATIGSIEANTQNLDLAPTLLDALGMPIPIWMEGKSLLASAPERLRPIFSIETQEEAELLDGWYEMRNSRPPFYSLRYVNVAICQRTFSLDLQMNVIAVSDLSGHSAPCDESDLPQPAEAKRMIVAHLRENGYDVSSLDAP